MVARWNQIASCRAAVAEDPIMKGAERFVAYGWAVLNTYLYPAF
jgi:hypothetical protein